MRDVRPFWIQSALDDLGRAADLMDRNGDDELASYMRSLAEGAEGTWDAYMARVKERIRRGDYNPPQAR